MYIFFLPFIYLPYTMIWLGMNDLAKKKNVVPDQRKKESRRRELEENNWEIKLKSKSQKRIGKKVNAKNFI
jgi:hypothetical protein